MSFKDWWKKQAVKFRDDAPHKAAWKLIDYLVAAFGLTIVGAVVVWFGKLVDWLSVEVAVSRVMLIVGLLVACIALIFAWLFRREVTQLSSKIERIEAVQAKPVVQREVTAKIAETFKQFSVIDERYSLEWHVLVEPRSWIDNSNLSKHELASLLAGPFHNDPKCKGELVIVQRTSGSETLSPLCIGCNALLFERPSDVGRMEILFIKRTVISELQRLKRKCARIEEGTRLESPAYHSFMEPAKIKSA